MTEITPIQEAVAFRAIRAAAARKHDESLYVNHSFDHIGVKVQIGLRGYFHSKYVSWDALLHMPGDIDYLTNAEQDCIHEVRLWWAQIDGENNLPG